jgi:hypothetical protein
MSEILACRRGLVETMKGCGGIPGKLQLDPKFEPLAAIIDAPAISQSVNVQFQPSLGGPVYVYVFGDQMGNVTITGTAFAGLCRDQSQSGIKEVIDYYNEQRASQRTETVTVTFGSESISGFLTRMTLSPRDPLYMLVSFSLVINALPKENG